MGVQVATRAPASIPLGQARVLDLAGADSLWAIDHWMLFVPLALWDVERFPAARAVRSPEETLEPFSLLGALSQVTRRARLGVAVTEAIRRHPAGIAQAALTQHHLSRGRFILGIGAGERENVEPYGLSYKGQVSRLEEALYVIRLLWKNHDRYVAHEGRFFTLDRAVIGLGPYKGTLPPVWVAAHGPKALRVAGRLGDGWLPTHQMEPAEYAERLHVIRGHAEEAGRTMASFTPSYEMRVVLGETHAHAHKLLDSQALRLGALVLPAEVWEKAGAPHPFGEAYRGIADWIPSHREPQEVLDAMAKVPFEVIHAAFDHGTWRQLASRALSYQALGLRHLVCANVTPLIDPKLALPSTRDLIRLIRSLKRP